MKKGLKIGLIVGGSVLIAGGAWVGLTKAGVIPNWFDIEVFCPKSFGVSTCEIEKYDECIGKCGLYDITLSGYSLEGYWNWYNIKSKSGEKAVPEFESLLFGTYNDEDKYINLMAKKYYQEWVNEVFYEHTDTISELESQVRQKYSCKQSCGGNPRGAMVKKPIIYLYPTIKTEINVSLGALGNLSHTYPKYNPIKGWNVIAQPNGDLEDIDTGRKLYALYREGKSDNETNFDEGFVVKGEDIIPFLEEKLAILGLNEREAEEFIVYRLPQMEGNEWNLIRFKTKAEQDENMPLNITPTPDTVIRVMMDWQAIAEPVNVPEQKLVTPERIGFTVVERGGSPRN